MDAQIITGTIVAIEDINKGGYPKKIVTLSINNKESVFIEFRQPAMMNRLQSFSILDKVQLAIKYEAKTSKSSGITYNNIYAKTIKKA